MTPIHNASRFYGAEIVCALKFLHRRGIVYRDLKLDNVCLDGDGHIRLIDFGMCVPRVYRYEPSAFCGTPEYMAPEVRFPACGSSRTFFSGPPSGESGKKLI